MITVQCSCGETYHAEERYIGASILCTNRNCGQPVCGPPIPSDRRTSRAPRWLPGSPCAMLLVESAGTSSIGVTTSGPLAGTAAMRGMRTPLQAFLRERGVVQA